MWTPNTSLTAERIRAMRAAGYWKNESLDQCLARWARRWPEKTAIVDGAGRYTYGELARAVERVAHGLRALRVGRGSVISCQLPNWNEFVLVALAACRLGAILNPIAPIYRGSELRFILNLLESQVLVIPERFRNFDYTEMLAGLWPETPRLAHVFVARGEPGAGMRPFASLTETAWEVHEAPGAHEGSDPNQVGEVIFTSGTTGEPKGVMHTPNTALSTLYGAIERLDFTERDVVLMASTFGHQTGYLYGVCLTLLLGATGVWLDVWSPEAGARLIESERVTCTMGATPFLQDLTHAQAIDRHDISSLRLFIALRGPPFPASWCRTPGSGSGTPFPPGGG